jgi:3-isopropylmalate/(R)-2-methylmalate dehydratase large subunit
MANQKKTLFQNIWDAHVVTAPEGEPALLYIDLHLIHEVTSPQAFDGLRLAGRTVRRPDRCLATVDHNVPTSAGDRLIIKDAIAAKQIETLRRSRSNRASCISSVPSSASPSPA